MKLFYQLNYTLIKIEFRFKTTKSHKSPVFLAEYCIFHFTLVLNGAIVQAFWLSLERFQETERAPN